MAHKSLPLPPAAGNGASTAPVAPPVAVPRLPQQARQPRRGMIALGVLLVAGGGLLSFQVAARVGDRSAVVVTVRDVPVGQRIAPADVTTSMVGADDRVARIPASRLRQVIGKVAAVDLRRGALVVPASLTDQLRPGMDQQLVPVAVKPSRLPARGLQPGDQVVTVEASGGPGAPPSGGGPAGGGAKAAPTSTDGEIAAVVDRVSGSPDVDGLIVVDLLVSESDGPRLAQAAADGRIVLVLTSRGR